MLTKFFKVSFLLAPLVFFACSSDSSSNNSVSIEGDSSLEESEIKETVEVKYDTVIVDGDTLVQVDTVITYDTVYAEVRDEVPYYASDSTIFSWDGELVHFSSSSKTEVSSSSSVTETSGKLPTVDGYLLIDNRDGNQYALVSVEGKLWMAENMRYEISGASYCYDSNCDKGTLYTYAALSDVCPGGFHLPNRTEMQTLQDLGASWQYWEFGGRMSGTSFGYYGDMGFYWLSKSQKIQDGDKDNCSSSSCGMIFVQKSEDYGDGESLFQEDEQAKGFSVRCVQD